MHVESAIDFDIKLSCDDSRCKDFYAIFSGINPENKMAGRNPNPLKPAEITLSLNEQSVWYLDRLIETGLYGNSRPEAAKIVIFDHCKLLVAQEKLTMAPTDGVAIART